MKKALRLGSILIMAMMIAAPSMSFATEERSFDASGKNDEVTAERLPDEATEVTVADSVEELAVESEATYDNDAFFTIDTSKDDSADLATDEVTEEVTEILSGGGSDSEKQSVIADTLEASGFYSAEESGESKVDVTSKFASQRLRLIAPHQEELNAYGAVKAVYFEDSYYLSYDSMEAAMLAYEALVSEYGDDAVFIDKPMKICSGEKGWGTEFMRLDHQKVLADNNGQVTVAVVDTGIQSSHPVFSGRTILDGKNFVNRRNDPSEDVSDDEGHGTEVSGIIAEATPSNVKILPLKALNSKGQGNWLDIYFAIRYAEEQGADIINLSLGGYSDDSEMEIYDAEFKNYNALIICAAGNENINMDAPGVFECPGEFNSTVCVGAITSGKARYYNSKNKGSNYGQAVDFAAPGSNISVAELSGSYGGKSGTSYASPYIAAAAATVKAGHEDYSNDQIINHLESISEDLGKPGRDVYYGAGCPRFAPKKITPTVKLSKAVFTWNNKVQTPTVTVYDGTKKLPSTQYKLTYTSGRKNVGLYSIKVTLKDNYSGEETVTYKIIPWGTKLTGVVAEKRAATVKWAKQNKRMSSARIGGYQIRYSLRKDFKSGTKTVTTAGYSKDSRKITGLKSKKTYYFRVRTYAKVGNTTCYSSWSPPRAVTVK